MCAACAKEIFDIGKDIVMSVLRTIVRELISLFIDDGSFALAIVAWVLAAAIALRAGVDPILASLILFAGLAVLLAENVWRSVGEIRSRR
jgi:hypothetical protein